MIRVVKGKHGVITMISEEELTAFKKKFYLLEKITKHKINSRYAQIKYVFDHPTVVEADEERIRGFEARIQDYESRYYALRDALIQTIKQRNAILDDAEELPGLGAMGAHALFIEDNGYDIALPELSTYYKDLLKQYAPQ